MNVDQLKQVITGTTLNSTAQANAKTTLDNCVAKEMTNIPTTLMDLIMLESAEIFGKWLYKSLRRNWLLRVAIFCSGIAGGLIVNMMNGDDTICTQQEETTLEKSMSHLQVWKHMMCLVEALMANVSWIVGNVFYIYNLF